MTPLPNTPEYFAYLLEQDKKNKEWLKAERINKVKEYKEEQERIINKKISKITDLKYRIQAILNYKPSIWLNHKQDKVFKYTKNPTKEELEKEEQYCIDNFIWII